MPDEGFTELAGPRVTLRRFRPGDVAGFVAYRSVPQVLIGDCAAMPHADDPRQCDIGFTLSPEHQGHGYATEAVRLLLAYLFTARGKHRIIAYCDSRNAASAALLERVGMRREGHLRESTWAKGEWTDDLVYALLQHEWRPG
jgi:RimJ/RimL family protein N-acetyltransferase